MKTEYPTTPHDTESTIATLEKHLGGIVNVSCEVHEAKDHDSLRDGNPVAAVEVNNLLEVYPVVTEEALGLSGRMTPKTRWAVDTYVDASDPSVGLFGCEPVEHSIHESLPEAVVEIAKLLVTNMVQASFDVEAEDAMAEEYYDDSMDGDHESALASAGFGTDEDYGCYDGGEEF